MPPALFRKKSNSTLSNDMEASVATTKSLHVLPSHLDEAFPKLPVSSHTNSAHELTTNTVGHLFSSPSDCTTDLRSSSVLPNMNQLKNSLASKSPMHRVVFPSTLCSHSVLQSKHINDYATEKNDASWNMEAVDNFLDIHMDIPVLNDQLETCTGLMVSEDHVKRTDWQEWANQLITVDDTLDSNWNDVLIDVSVPDPDPKLLELPLDVSKCQPQLQQPQCHHVLSGQSPNVIVWPSAASTKARMRWTPELHEVFLDSVNKLGGGERATPKGVLKLMNIEGLTIYHVKSHLQKYRTARVKPESSEGTSEQKSNTATDIASLDLKTTMGITEALRVQMEVQKQLHEQLEIQRNLQLRIEEQGKHLQMMFEQQKKMEEKKLKASSSHSNEPSETDHATIKEVSPNVCDSGDEYSNKKEISCERKLSEEHEQDAGEYSPPLKRAKVSEAGTS